MASEVTVIASGASSSCRVGPHTENFVLGTSPDTTVVMSEGSGKKKRGRPRKYIPGKSSSNVFSPMPPPSSAPPGVGKSYAEERKTSLERPIKSERKYRNKVGAEKLDEWDDCLTGSSFLPHVITVDAGEDIWTKIMEFSLRGPRSVCVLCGNGTVSNVTIRHPSSSRGTFTYEGLFEILSFTGSFNPVEISGPESERSSSCGTMAISLAGADGRVIGGFVGGLTIAASPIKVIVASFLLGNPLVVKPKQQKMGTPFPIDGSGPSDPRAVDLEKRVTSYNTQGTINWESIQIAGTSQKTTADINISLHG